MTPVAKVGPWADITHSQALARLRRILAMDDEIKPPRRTYPPPEPDEEAARE